MNLFCDFLEEYNDIKSVVLEETFFQNLKSLVEKEIFWSKRHSGSISFEDTQDAREKIVGNFENTRCLLVELLEIGKTV